MLDRDHDSVLRLRVAQVFHRVGGIWRNLGDLVGVGLGVVFVGSGLVREVRVGERHLAELGYDIGQVSGIGLRGQRDCAVLLGLVAAAFGRHRRGGVRVYSRAGRFNLELEADVVAVAVLRPRRVLHALLHRDLDVYWSRSVGNVGLSSAIAAGAGCGRLGRGLSHDSGSFSARDGKRVDRGCCHVAVWSLGFGQCVCSDRQALDLDDAVLSIGI